MELFDKMEMIHGLRPVPSCARLTLNGCEPTLAELAVLAQLNYGHFTTMQVRERRVRGFGLHLQRLLTATRELFASELDVECLRAQIRQVLDDEPASLRITVFSLAFDRVRPELPVDADVLVTTSPARAPRSGPLRLKSMVFQRVLPHIKHIGMFGLLHLSRQARIDGFDDVVLTTVDGEIAEGSTWSIGFWDGRRVIWPSAPALPGTAQQLIQRGLREHGIACVTAPVRLDQLAGFHSAFMLNAGSVGPMIESIDAQNLHVDASVHGMLKAAWESQPMENI